MRDWTKLELVTKINNDLDLTDQSFVTAQEMEDLLNEAIDEAEAEIHKLGLEEEYFLTSSFLSLVAATSAYAMPSDMYANKIRSIIYRSGAQYYVVRRVRGKDKFLKLADIDANGSAEDYQYIIVNTASLTANNRRITLYPTSRETSSTVMKVWYIRNANRLTLDAHLLDIPEFASFILWYTKAMILSKAGDPRSTEALAALQNQRKLMIDTLQEMVPDADNVLEPDLSHYENHE